MTPILNQTTVTNFLISHGLPKDIANGLILFLQAYHSLREGIRTQEQIVMAWEEKPRCFGTKSFRDGIYLYINHSPTQFREFGACPCHGWGKDGQKRHFVYIGKDLVKQDEATIALKNWAHWEAQRDKLLLLNNKLKTLDRSLKNLIDNAKNQGSLF